MPNLRKKFKWAIDITKSQYDKVIVHEFDYGWGLAMAVENKDGEMRGLVLQRPLFDKDRRFRELYGLKDNKKTRQNLTDWLQRCFDEPVKTKSDDEVAKDIIFDVRDC